ncbi:ABC transporter permease [Orrella marina]|uniref:ABC transporter permease n=2 Tax=Orrella marina TaxID=2163011 RepID=A0A2R4XMN0_9BURK|nr:ABC transporter permease [Orrella marina]
MQRAKSLVMPLAILMYWQLIASSGLVSSYLLPAPETVWTAAKSLYASGILSHSILVSLSRVFQGFGISCVLAFALALLVNGSRTVEQLLSAPLALLRMIPPLAMTPLLILWFGIGSTTQLAIIILASIFPVFLNTRDGLRRVDPSHQELARSLQLGRLRYFRWIVLPGAVPSIITGVRVGFGYSWRALIGAELIAASAGLGYLIIDSQEMMRTDDVMVGILTIGMIGWLLDTLFDQLLCRKLSRRFPEICRS